MANADPITVEVSYARPDEQLIIEVRVAQNATLKQAILDSGILRRFPEITLDVNKVGIFGKLKDLDHRLLPGDRVEIYRPLIADPKEVRRQRVEEKKEGYKLAD